MHVGVLKWNFVVERCCAVAARRWRSEGFVYLFSIGLTAANAVRPFTLEGGNAQPMSLGTVVSSPGVELDHTLDIAAVGFFQIGGGLSGFAKNCDLHPLDGVILTDTDA
jgi:hypothetical protein